MKQTRLFQLREGDRFYFLGDRKKVVHQVRKVEKKSPIKSKIMFVETTDMMERHQDRDVMLLRNINDPP